MNNDYYLEVGKTYYRGGNLNASLTDQRLLVDKNNKEVKYLVKEELLNAAAFVKVTTMSIEKFIDWLSGPISEEKALSMLSKRLQYSYASEIGNLEHFIADNLLCEVLESLGYEELVQEFREIDKGYSKEKPECI